MDVYLLRHAKAVDYTPTDHERSLSGKGLRQSDACGLWMASQGVSIDLAIVSDAQRTLETWQGLKLECPVNVTSEAYQASAPALERLIQQSGDAQSVLLIAHNPGISDLARQAGYEHDLKTCQLVHLNVDGHSKDFWAELAHVVDTYRPTVDAR